MLRAWPHSLTDEKTVFRSGRAGAACGLLKRAAKTSDSSVRPIWEPGPGVLVAGDVRLYNRVQLRSELESTQETDTDLGLVLAGFLKWGHDVPLHLVGDFAFAIWDERQRIAFAARDHLGVRPLYFHVSQDHLHIASDPGQFLPVLSTCQIDAGAILDRLLLRPRSYGLSYFRGVTALKPGHSISFKNGEISEKRYWIPTFRERWRRTSYEDVCAELRETFMSCVNDRLDSDYPIVAHSSGGYDSSSIVVAATRRYLREAGPTLVLASARTPGMPCDDGVYMDAVSRVTGFASVSWNATAEFPITLNDQRVSFPGLISGIGGGPPQDLAIARDLDARVLLGGAFGDILMYAFGVSRDRFAARSENPSQVRSFKQLLKDSLGLFSPELALKLLDLLRVSRVQSPNEWMGPVLRAHLRERWQPTVPLKTQWPSHLACELWAAISGPIGAGNIASAIGYGAFGDLEVRLPYADVRFVESVLDIPVRYRLGARTDRQLSRDLFDPILPPEFKARQGQGSWLSVWAKNARRLIPEVRELLHDGRWLSAPFIDRDAARDLAGRVMRRGLAAGRELLLLHEIGVLEAWLRLVSEYHTARMANSVEEFGSDGTIGKRVPEYEPPKVSLVGNVRDLVAGGGGTNPDGSPIPPNNQKIG